MSWKLGTEWVLSLDLRGEWSGRSFGGRLAKLVALQHVEIKEPDWRRF